MTTQTVETSPKMYARIAGVLYLINIVVGFFAIGYVPGVITVAGNFKATANNILAHEFLYRLGVVAHIIILLTNIPLAVIFYRLFSIVNKNATLLVVFFTLVGTAIEAAALINQFEPLILLKEGISINTSTTEQLQALAFLDLHLQTFGFNLALIFFGFYGISMGFLIFKSAFFPKVIGVFLAIGGACYLFYSFSNFLSPQFANSLVPYIQMPSGLAELGFCVWMLIAGVNTAKWKQKQMLYKNA